MSEKSQSKTTVALSPEDYVLVIQKANELGWTPKEILHFAIREYVNRANPIWDAKGAKPFETLRLINEMFKGVPDEING